MKIEIDKTNRIIYVKLMEEIDHHSCEYIKRKIDTEISKHKPQKLILDMEGVEFMDSSGIGLILGRYKNAMRNNGKMGLINLCSNIKRVFEMSGIFRVVDLYNDLDDVVKSM